MSNSNKNEAMDRLLKPSQTYKSFLEIGAEVTKTFQKLHDDYGDDFDPNTTKRERRAKLLNEISQTRLNKILRKQDKLNNSNKKINTLITLLPTTKLPKPFVTDLSKSVYPTITLQDDGEKWIETTKKYKEEVKFHESRISWEFPLAGIVIPIKPIATKISFYSNLQIHDLVVTVEHCHSCSKHSTYCRHDEKKYLNQANEMLQKISKILCDYQVCVCLGVVRIESDLNARCMEVDSPRLGAFEIQLAYRSTDGTLYYDIIHSKLACRKWPSKTILEKKILTFISKSNIITLMTLKKSLSEKKVLGKSQDNIDKLNELIRDESIIEIDNTDDDNSDMINELNTTLWKDTKLCNPTWIYDKENCIINETVLASGLHEVQWVFDNTEIIVETPEGEIDERLQSNAQSFRSENFPSKLNKSSSHKLIKTQSKQKHILPLDENNNKSSNIKINQSNSNIIEEINVFDKIIGKEIQVFNILNPRGGLERYPLIGKIIPNEIKIENTNELIKEKNIIISKKELRKIKKHEKYIASLNLKGRNLKPSEMLSSDEDDDDEEEEEEDEDDNNENQKEADDEQKDEDSVSKKQENIIHYVTVQLKYYQVSCDVLSTNIIDALQDKKEINLYVVPIELEALFLLIEKYNINNNCIWKLLDGIDFKSQIYPDDPEEYFLSRSSFFHQIRNLVWEFDNMNELKDENKNIIHPRLHCIIDLQLCYSEDILNWVFEKFGSNDGILVDVNALNDFICKEMSNNAKSLKSFNLNLSMESQEKKQYINTSNDTIDAIPTMLIKTVEEHLNDNLTQYNDNILPFIKDQQLQIQSEEEIKIMEQTIKIMQQPNKNHIADKKSENNNHLQSHEIGSKNSDIPKFQPPPPNVKPPPPAKNNNGRTSPNIWKPIEKQSSFNSISDINIQEQHIRVEEIENKLIKLLSSENLNNLIEETKEEEKENHEKKILKKSIQMWGN